MGGRLKNVHVPIHMAAKLLCSLSGKILAKRSGKELRKAEEKEADEMMMSLLKK